MATKAWIDIWNRKLHYYIGLYLLLFIWLFSISGLFLNHPKWEFAQFWPQREQAKFEHAIQAPEETDERDKVRNLMQQLELEGEIEQLTWYPAENFLEFRIVRPGEVNKIKANFNTGQAKVEQITTNIFGILHYLHLFNGVSMDRPERSRDWVMTWLWTLAMDAVALGMIFLVLSSLYMWYGLSRQRVVGLICLLAGTLCCGFFVFGLGWRPI